MIWALCTAALASELSPVGLVNELFPTAQPAEINGQPALAPIHRNGEVGFIEVRDISVLTLGDRILVSFGLDTAKGVEPTPEALSTASKPQGEGNQGEWTRIFAVVLLEDDGSFVAKPDGWPLEQPVNINAMGDFMDMGPSGELKPVDDGTSYVIVELNPSGPESPGAIIPIEVEGDTLVAHDRLSHGGGSSLSGCQKVQEFGNFRERDGALKASRKRVCWTQEGCEDICDDFPRNEHEITMMTLVEAD